LEIETGHFVELPSYFFESYSYVPIEVVSFSLVLCKVCAWVITNSDGASDTSTETIKHIFLTILEKTKSSKKLFSVILFCDSLI